MKKLLSFSIALLSITTLVACSGHKAESKVPEEKIEQKQIKFDEKLFKEAGLLPFKNEKQLELGELDSNLRTVMSQLRRESPSRLMIQLDGTIINFFMVMALKRLG